MSLPAGRRRGSGTRCRGGLLMSDPALLDLSAPDAAPISSRQILGRGPWQLAWARLRHDRVAVVSAVVIVIIVLAAIFAPVVGSTVGHGPATPSRTTGITAAGIPKGPSSRFLFGTDDLG